eukprot:TRINITY_DN915_c0_g1_i5.p1 TRINITY_DN915_c0_g1~~TRINITY_DN915_c0_g1_i5.p1  ORF type:complete len:281 (+),score=66.69 TRINITY_DN915_c0_g1_i5:139-981(+)
MEGAQESARTPEQHTLSIFGVGNIGSAIARGILYSKIVEPTQVTLTRRHIDPLKNQFTEGVNITGNNTEAAKSKVLFLCVPPAQLNELIDEIKSVVKEGQVVVSIVSGAEISDIENRFGNASLDIIRAMPNTAIAFRESMTCLSSKNPKSEGMELVKRIFDALGSTMIVEEKQMVPATALCACGIAFFCRAIRAASQGGIEIGFHSEDAIKLAAQTAKGAATLLLASDSHPEREVDKVTTPQGCTIAGLNQMEHSGFSSAFIKGIVTSAEKAAVLYKNKK